MFLFLLIIGIVSLTTATFSSFSDLIPEVPNPLNVVFHNKCIEDLGCFYTGPPFFHPLNRPLSLTPTDQLKTKFNLFTPSNPQKEEELNLTSRSIELSSFDPKLPLKVLIHGYRSDLDVGDIRFELKDAFLNVSDVNIIIVDWTEHNGPPYPQAVANARAVGAQLANLLKLIMKTTGLRAENIHLIGHSLGGQMAGWTGERIPNLGRITGLDPAGPYFQDGENEVRLDATDAVFVDIIHTDGGENIVDGLGIGDPVGHMDFYPNGGRRQPGCFYTSESRNLVGTVVNMVFQNKCMEDLGCFYTGPPFYHPIHRPISLTPTSNLKVRFTLFTPTNPEKGEDLDITETSVKQSSFDSKIPLKVLIHGYRTDLEENDVRFQTKDALLNLGKYNVIIVDWTENNGPPFPQAVANARAVGAKLAKMLKLLMRRANLKAQDIHLIGHSLGGHISGWAGERIPKIGRITGLDPAGPYFQNSPKEVRLDTTDAVFVDVIHTDGGDNVLDLGLGHGQPMGHMDFYPNGGYRQPGCAYTAENENIIGSFVNTTSKVFSSVCSHTRVNNYFLESIDNTKCRFLATWCNSYKDFEKGDCFPEKSTVAEMGFHAKKIKGVPNKSKFYLRTNDKEPFCIQNSIHLTNDE